MLSFIINNLLFPYNLAFEKNDSSDAILELLDNICDSLNNDYILYIMV